MRLTLKQLRSVIRQEGQSLHEDAFNLAAHGREARITGTGEDKKWHAVKADSKMVANALARVEDAVLDQDEEAAAKWLQSAASYAKKAYKSLLPEL